MNIFIEFDLDILIYEEIIFSIITTEKKKQTTI